MAPSVDAEKAAPAQLVQQLNEQYEKVKICGRYADECCLSRCTLRVLIMCLFCRLTKLLKTISGLLKWT